MNWYSVFLHPSLYTRSQTVRQLKVATDLRGGVTVHAEAWVTQMLGKLTQWAGGNGTENPGLCCTSWEPQNAAEADVMQTEQLQWKTKEKVTTQKCFSSSVLKPGWVVVPEFPSLAWRYTLPLYLASVPKGGPHLFRSSVQPEDVSGWCDRALLELSPVCLQAIILW